MLTMFPNIPQSLNPCSNGIDLIYRQGSGSMRYYQRVLILVLME